MAAARRRPRRRQRAGPAEIVGAAVMFVGILLGINQIWGPWIDVGALIPDAPPTQAAPPPGKPAPPGAKPGVAKTPPPGTLPCALEGGRQQACIEAKAYAYGVVLAKWGRAEWPCADRLWNNESEWNAWAVNPSSDAFGIAQILPFAHGHPPGTELGHWRGQLDWGIAYVEQTYGAPCRALAAWNSRYPHWY